MALLRAFLLRRQSLERNILAGQVSLTVNNIRLSLTGYPPCSYRVLTNGKTHEIQVARTLE